MQTPLHSVPLHTAYGSVLILGAGFGMKVIHCVRRARLYCEVSFTGNGIPTMSLLSQPKCDSLAIKGK